MKQLAYILCTAVFVYFSCLGAGRVLLRLFKIDLYRSEERFIGFVLGSSGLSLAVFGLSLLHLVYQGVFLALGILFIAGGQLAAAGRERPDLPALPRLWRNVFWAGYALYAVLYVTNVVIPEISPDGISYHIGLILPFYRAHSFVGLTHSMLAHFPQGVEMLFLFAFLFGKHAGAAVVHALFLLSLPMGMLCYSRRFGMPEAGVTGALLVFMSPVVGKDGVSAYIDVALAAVVFAGFYLLQIWATERERRLLVPIGLLSGFAYAIKYLAFVAAPYALAFVALHLRKAREAMRAVLVMSACAAAMMAPWMIKNAVVVGNPVAPFANTVFRNQFLHISMERSYRLELSNFNGVTRAQLPWEVCVSGGRLLGVLGPVFLLTPLALAALRDARGRQLWIAAAVFCVTPLISLQTRFFIPALPFLALALGMVLCRWRLLGVAVLALHAVLSWPSVIPRYASGGAWHIVDLPWRAALRIESEEQYLVRNLDSWEMCRLVNQRVPAGQPVLALGFLPRSWVDRDVWAPWESAAGERMLDTLLAGRWENMTRDEYRFASRYVGKIRVTQTDKNDAANWDLSELRLYDGGREVQRSPAWSLTAWPNPWDVQLAFDNNPATRWSTWEAFRPGMFVEIDFGTPVRLDEVAVESLVDYGAQLRLESWEGGAWRDMQARLTAGNLPKPPGLRRRASAYLKASGIRWLLFDITDDLAVDFATHRESWGVSLAASTPKERLYHID